MIFVIILFAVIIIIYLSTCAVISQFCGPYSSVVRGIYYHTMTHKLSRDFSVR